MKITKVEIRNLFGYIDHIIDFNSEKEVTIIFGLNGVGKTTILKLIYDIIKGRDIYNHWFDRIQIDFDNLEKLIIERKTIDIKYFTYYPLFEHTFTYFSGKTITFSKGPFYIDNNKKAKPIELTTTSYKEDSDQKEIYLNEIDKIHEENMSKDEKKLKEYEEMTQSTDYYSKNKGRFERLLYEYLINLEKTKGRNKELEKKLLMVSISLIQTQRFRNVDFLLEWYNKGFVDVFDDLAYFEEKTTIILECADNLKKELKYKFVKTNREFTEINKTYSARLEEYLKDKKYQDTSKGQLKLESKNLKTKIERHFKIGLINKKQSDKWLEKLNQKLLETNYGQFCFDVIEVKNNLNQYKEIMDSVSLFINLINRRFHQKQIDVNITEGIVVYTKDGSPIPLNSISSGEKNLLVIYYKSIFELPENSFVVIDEPEISLHVAWQEEFINDLLEIQKFTKHYFLVATHSPQIIYDHWDLTVGLEIKNE